MVIDKTQTYWRFKKDRLQAGATECYNHEKHGYNCSIIYRLYPIPITQAVVPKVTYLD